MTRPAKVTRTRLLLRVTVIGWSGPGSFMTVVSAMDAIPQTCDEWQSAARAALSALQPNYSDRLLSRCMRAAMSGANRTLYEFFSHRRTQTDTSGPDCFLSLVALIGLSQTCPCERT